VEISRTHFGFEDCPKNYGEREVGYMQSGRFLDKEWNFEPKTSKRQIRAAL
jgi:hypothetical protein